HQPVRGSGLRRTDALVRAAPPPVVIRRDEGLIAEPGLRLHCYPENIPQTLRTREIIAEVAGLTDESVCPTLARPLRRFHFARGARTRACRVDTRVDAWFCGAGAFACQPALSRLLSTALGLPAIGRI